jgi:hypothetical protein
MNNPTRTGVSAGISLDARVRQGRSRMKPRWAGNGIGVSVVTLIVGIFFKVKDPHDENVKFLIVGAALALSVIGMTSIHTWQGFKSVPASAETLPPEDDISVPRRIWNLVADLFKLAFGVGVLYILLGLWARWLDNDIKNIGNRYVSLIFNLAVAFGTLILALAFVGGIAERFWREIKRLRF